MQSVSKTYGPVVALKDLSLDLERGEVFGYIGPNGAGKTTTIKILTGLVREFGGEVEIDGINARDHTEMLSSRIGYLPQDVGFQEWRTVEHALTTFGLLSGIDRHDLTRSIDRSLDLAGITEHRDRRIVHLSGGTVQRLRLAQAILHDPEILILDEPMSGLDPASRFAVRRIIADLAGENRLVFVSSHILSELEDLATRIGILHDGQMREVGTPSELRQRYQVGTVVEVQCRPGSEVEFDGLSGSPIGRIQTAGPQRVLLHVETGVGIDDAMRIVMKRAVEKKIPVRTLRHVQPSLEDVYMNLTSGSRT